MNNLPPEFFEREEYNNFSYECLYNMNNIPPEFFEREENNNFSYECFLPPIATEKERRRIFSSCFPSPSQDENLPARVHE